MPISINYKFNKKDKDIHLTLLNIFEKRQPQVNRYIMHNWTTLLDIGRDLRG